VGAALGLMVCRIEAAKNQQAAGELITIGDRLAEISARLQQYIQGDAEAYDRVMTAYRLPKTDPARAERIASALQAATEVPLATATLGLEAARLLRQLLPRIKPSMVSDLKVGMLMALAAIEGGLENVGINLKSLPNQQIARDILTRVEAIKHSLVELRRL
jgi:formiminotetrahydrofolate cyclodeaminase